MKNQQILNMLDIHEMLELDEVLKSDMCVNNDINIDMNGEETRERSMKKSIKENMKKLTKIERKIIILIALGLSNIEISHVFNNMLSIHDVKECVNNILYKLNMKKRIELLNYIISYCINDSLYSILDI